MQIATNFNILISALWQKKVFRDAERFQPTHMISLTDPEYIISKELSAFTQNYFLIKAKDATDSHANTIPNSTLIELMNFLDTMIYMSKKKEVRLLIHCHLGASRSPAVGYIALSRFFGYGFENKAFQALLKLTNKPWPNHGIIASTDRLFNYNGSLLAPLDFYRQKWPQRLQAYRRLNKMLKRVSEIITP